MARRSRGGPNGAILVGSVTSGSPADEAGLRPGDRILALYDVVTTDLAGLQSLMVESRIGKHVVVRLLRDDKRIALDVVLVELLD